MDENRSDKASKAKRKKTFQLHGNANALAKYTSIRHIITKKKT